MAQPGFQALIGALGFYPVVPDADWVKRLLCWGVRSIQLRHKPLMHDDEALARQVRESVAAARDVAGAQGVDIDARAHGRGDHDALKVTALGRTRLEPHDFLESGRVVLDQLLRGE